LPFTPRTNFEDIVENKDTIKYLKILSKTFTRLPHLMCKEFFAAPLKVFKKPNTELGYYASPRAIEVYNFYIKSLDNLDPDKQIKRITDSYKFIYTFCVKHNLELKDYPYFKTVATYDCLKHIKDHHVSPYVAFSFPELYSVLINTETDVYHLFFGDMDMRNLQQQYERSSKAKVICPKYKNEIDNRLQKRLKK
jgi:hypothetical protein